VHVLDDGQDNALLKTSGGPLVHRRKALRARWKLIEGVGLRCVWIIELEGDLEAGVFEQTDTEVSVCEAIRMRHVRSNT
jgi:hypothetical protein